MNLVKPFEDDNWVTFRVSDLRLRGDFPTNLRIKKHKNTPNLYAHWLPDLKDDPREIQKGKKRLDYSKSMNTDDPVDASKRAITWVKELQDELRDKKNLRDGLYKNTLKDYWEIYYKQEVSKREVKENFKRWNREEKLKWNSPSYGLNNQSWSGISVDQITRNDYVKYFDSIEKRVLKETKGKKNGSGMKEQQKTLINKLLSYAESDFTGHSFPTFPTISKNKRRDQVNHFKRDEFDLLMKRISELSEGAVQSAITPEQYNSLPYTPFNRKNVRNWVDLHDAIFLMWFFYLRPQDMYVLRSEWFEERDEDWVLNLETTKQDRQKHTTTHYRPDAPKYVKRIFGRKPEGFVIFPEVQRDSKEIANNRVLLNLNFLLKSVIDECIPKFPEKDKKWVTLRHTSLRLTLEEDRDLWVPPQINSFSDNAHTSPDMLRQTYINYIESESTAKRSRKNIRGGAWELFRGTKGKK